MEDDFSRACFYNDLDEIKRLAPYFDLNNTRFKKYFDQPTPLISCINLYGNMEAVDLLLSMGAKVTPYDAYHILFMVDYDINVPRNVYLDFFLSKGYNIVDLAIQCDQPFEQ